MFAGKVRATIYSGVSGLEGTHESVQVLVRLLALTSRKCLQGAYTVAHLSVPSVLNKIKFYKTDTRSHNSNGAPTKATIKYCKKC